MSQGDEHKFVTNGQPLKSPPGMFPQEVDNDLKAVDAAVREYWGLKPLTEEKEEPNA